MAKWKQLLPPAAGALPPNVVTKVAVGLIAVLITLLVLVQMLGGGREEEGGVFEEALDEGSVVGSGMVGRLEAELGRMQEQQRETAARERARAAALLEEEAARERERAAAATAAAAAAVPGLPVALPPSAGAAGMPLAAVPTTGEAELQERLRLEELERRTRSLRTPSVVQTTRAAAVAQAGGVPLEQVAGQLPGGAQRPAAPPAVPGAPDMSALLNQIEASTALLGGGGTGAPAPVERTVPGVTGPPVEETAGPVKVTEPDDEAGWERVYEGSRLSAVLVTQLDGEFAGPVLAEVSIPFYSRDRQRILVPRGARLLGSAQPVQSQDQSRLAVGFHRLIWPDGRWVDLGFHGLNALGESALRDQVDRHYVSMFAAAGAVGLLSGLTLQGSNPYAGGLEGFRAGAGEGFGQSATQILQRFLNRLPTVTIRAGHRLQVWVTGDFLTPRPAPHPERMFR